MIVSRKKVSIRMNKLTENLISYIRDTLGVPSVIEKWSESKSLPFYLRENYMFFTLQFMLDLFGSKYLLLVDRNNQEQSALKVKKNIEALRSRSNMEVVYVREAVTAYNRKRLIEQHIPFIVPSNQMYLPTLGIDLREYMRRIKEKQNLFSPSTQILLLNALLSRETVLTKPSKIGAYLGYSTMTIIRSFDQLEMAELAEHSKVGKERHLHLNYKGEELWNNAQVFLSSPVKRYCFAHQRDSLFSIPNSGYTALAHYTNLAEPSIPVKAIYWRKWSPIRNKLEDTQAHLFQYPDSFRIELWKYDPGKLNTQNVVDPLSLYLSLRNEDDERTQEALASLVKDIRW